MLTPLSSERFIDSVADTFGKLTSKQVRGLEFLIKKLIASERIDTFPKMAYVLATVQWETAHTFQPVTEYGSKAYLANKRYYPYIGRGYIQLTWYDNYRRFGNFLGIDLINYPEQATDPDVAWRILEIGMTDPKYGLQAEDPDFTKYTLEDFFHTSGNDYYHARKIINPNDLKSYQPIAEAAVKFYRILTLIANNHDIRAISL